MTEKICLDFVSRGTQVQSVPSRIEHMTIGDRHIQLIVPKRVPQFELIRWVEDSEFTILLLAIREAIDFDHPPAVVAIARKLDETTYETVFWHTGDAKLWESLDIHV